jgi:hypothetical protein
MQLVKTLQKALMGSRTPSPCTIPPKFVAFLSIEIGFLLAMQTVNNRRLNTGEALNFIPAYEKQTNNRQHNDSLEMNDVFVC